MNFKLGGSLRKLLPWGEKSCVEDYGEDRLSLKFARQPPYSAAFSGGSSQTASATIKYSDFVHILLCQLAATGKRS